MNLAIKSLAALLLSLIGTLVCAQDKPTAAADPSTPKLKVLYITGGGYHKYEELAPIITEGIKKHTGAEIDVKWNLEALRDKKLGEGYDAIIYNICFARENDPQMIDAALRVTREGKPTLMVHCSMHTFMESDAWTECCGQRTRSHDKYKPFATEKVTADHPAIKRFPDDWKTPGDELYRTIEFPESSTALLRSTTPDDNGNRSVVCWVHKYGQGPVFATTLGHDMKTCEQDAYHRLLADGLLWACGRLESTAKAEPVK